MKILGLPYPIIRHPQGLLRSSGDIEQIKADMLQVILTRPGERVMEPEFGTPLHNINPALATPVPDQARRIIASSIMRWEPRVQVSEVLVRWEPGDEYMAVTIYFVEPIRLQKTEELTVEILIGDE